MNKVIVSLLAPLAKHPLFAPVDAAICAAAYVTARLTSGYPEAPGVGWDDVNALAKDTLGVCAAAAFLSNLKDGSAAPPQE